MVTETLVKETLASKTISLGKNLVLALDKAQFIVAAALWLYLPETGTWRLMIASPQVRSEGPRKAYKKIQSVLSKLSSAPARISLQDIAVVDSNDSFISLLRNAVRTEDGISDIRFTKNTINGFFIEDAHIYRLT